MGYNLKLCCFIGLILLWSCERVQDNKRMLFVGNIKDDIGNPITGAQVSATLFDSEAFENPQNIIGQNKTDKNGDFQVVSLVPYNSTSNLLINSNFDSKESIEPLYTRLAFVFFNGVFDESLEVNLNNLVLPRLSDLEINIRKTSSTTAVLDWSLDFQRDMCTLEIRSQEDFENISFCSDFIRTSNQNNATEPEVDKSFTSLRNSTAIFTYSINNEPDQTIEIPLNEANNVFEFTY